MNYFEQALKLSELPVTLEDFLEWEQLLQQARGEEADAIGELYTTMMANASEDVHEQYVLQSVGN